MAELHADTRRAGEGVLGAARLRPDRVRQGGGVLRARTRAL